MTENQSNPDNVRPEILLQEINRLDPRLFELAVSNIRAAQWKQLAQELANHTHEPPDEGVDVKEVPEKE